MNGKRLIQGFLVFLAIFVAGLIYTQFFAYYERRGDVEAVSINGVAVPVAQYEGIDSASSPLKLRGCFMIDPAAVADLAPAADATPLTPPFWFRCFDTAQLDADLASGAAVAYAIGPNEAEGFDTMLAVYPDGRGFLWRQLAAEFAE